MRDRAQALFDSEPGVVFGPVVGAPFPVEEASEKLELGRISRGVAVDMETASVFGAATRAHVPFLAVRFLKAGGTPGMRSNQERAGAGAPFPYDTRV